MRSKRDREELRRQKPADGAETSLLTCLASASGTQRTECTACAAWSEDFNEGHEVKYPCRKATSFSKLSDLADCGQLNSRCTARVPT